MSLFNRRRELCLASVFALALTGVAGAADLAVKAPIFAPPPVFSWTGIYIGIGGGTGWGNTDFSSNQDAIRAALFNQGLLPPAGPPRRDNRIAPDQWRVFRRPTRSQLAGRLVRVRHPG